MSRQKLNPRLLSPKASDFNQFTFKQETPRESPSMMSISRDKPYISTKQLPRCRLNTSFACQQSRSKFHSPTYSEASSVQQEYYKSVQWFLLNENSNLKEHIDFLSAQIRTLFQRQRRQSEVIRVLQIKCKQFQHLNVELQRQLHFLTNQTITEIQRIQEMLRVQRVQSEQLLLSSVSKSQQLGSQTEETINNNLQQLKAQVSSIITTFSPKQTKYTNQQRQNQVKASKNYSGSKKKTPTFELHEMQVNDKNQQQEEYSFYFDLPPEKELQKYLNFHKVPKGDSNKFTKK